MHDKIKRSNHWDELRDKLIKERGSKCEISGATTDLEAHHIIPFHFCVLLGRPELELEKKNIIILSGGPINYHLLIGHLGNFESFNKDILNIRKWQKIAAVLDIKENEMWIKTKIKRPKEWKDMTKRNKTDLRKLMDRLFPPI